MAECDFKIFFLNKVQCYKGQTLCTLHARLNWLPHLLSQLMDFVTSEMKGQDCDKIVRVLWRHHSSSEAFRTRTAPFRKRKVQKQEIIYRNQRHSESSPLPLSGPGITGSGFLLQSYHYKVILVNVLMWGALSALYYINGLQGGPYQHILC